MRNVWSTTTHPHVCALKVTPETLLWHVAYLCPVRTSVPSRFSLLYLYLFLLLVLEERPDPCRPSPCGPYSQCRVINNHAVCSCQANYIGTPPACRPECMVSSDCAQDRACVNTKCQDPCPGSCGQNARCQIVSHNPICSCSPGFTGDPFVRCIPEESKGSAPTLSSSLNPGSFPERPVERPRQNPCVPSPCGPNSQCRVVGDTPACSCLNNYIGRPPNCRPECTINSECPPTQACQNERCTDPCPGSCGANAECTVLNHRSVCSCRGGFTGDPFSGCSIILSKNTQLVSRSPLTICPIPFFVRPDTDTYLLPTF